MKNRVGEKRCPNDFALWKAAKPGEPSWESPFGPGRPGWHIECSVMSNNVLLKEFGGFECHLGGKDLQFPHHANEVAQLEAFYNKSDLIDFFMHSGHLRIDNEVMSKSKMNFKTIESVLNQYTANQLRVLFLQVDFASDINYSVNQLDNAVALEQKIVQFFQNVNTLEIPARPPVIGAPEMTLLKQMADTKQQVKQAYADNFNYPQGFKLLIQLIDSVKAYIATEKFEAYVAKQVADCVKHQLEILGFKVSSEKQDANTLEVVNVLNDFRSEIKALTAEGQLTKGNILKACDEVRDKKLPPLGYAIEDKAGQKSVVKEINY